MFEYNYNSKDHILDIMLPKQIKFSFSFLTEMTHFIQQILDLDCEVARVACPQNAVYDNLSKAYLFMVLRSMIDAKRLLWSRDLAQNILPSIHPKTARKFENIDLVKTLSARDLSYYSFKSDDPITNAVNEIAKLLVENNVALNADEIKEFLSTTIGEIFSNCFLHSNRNEAFLLYDIKLIDKFFYLTVNITDFGKTLVSNVKDYFLSVKQLQISSIDGFRWAITEGNTTRAGSGGYGLSTLIDYVKKANGSLHIFSGDAYYSYDNGKPKIGLSRGKFAGTSVTFTAKLYDTSQVMTYDSSKKQLITISLDNI